MSLDERPQLTTYGRYLDEIAPPISAEEYESTATIPLGPETPRVRPWRSVLIALGVGAAVVVLIAATATIFDGTANPPAGDETPAPPTTPSTVADSTTPDTLPSTEATPSPPPLDSNEPAQGAGADPDSGAQPPNEDPAPGPIGPGTWVQTDPDQAGFDDQTCCFYSLVSTDFGLIATTQRCTSEGTDCVPVAWLSDDGRSWAAVDLPEVFRGASIIAGGPGALAVINEYEDETGTLVGRAGVWASADGRTWEELIGFDSGEAREDAVWLNDVVTMDDQIAVLASTTSWPAFSANPPHSIWTSEGGDAWHELPLTDLSPGEADAWAVRGLGAVGDTYFLVGDARTSEPFSSRIVVWVSENLSNWELTANLEPSAFTRMWHIPPMEWAGGALIWGVGCDEDGSCWEPQIHLVSDDALTWTRVTPDPVVFAEVDATAVVPGGPGVVAFFRDTDGGISIWQSADGAGWDAVDHDESGLTEKIGAITYTGREFVVLGMTPDDRWTSWIWTPDD